MLQTPECIATIARRQQHWQQGHMLPPSNLACTRTRARPSHLQLHQPAGSGTHVALQALQITRRLVDQILPASHAQAARGARHSGAQLLARERELALAGERGVALHLTAEQRLGAPAGRKQLVGQRMQRSSIRL